MKDVSRWYGGGCGEEGYVGNHPKQLMDQSIGSPTSPGRDFAHFSKYKTPSGWGFRPTFER